MALPWTEVNVGSDAGRKKSPLAQCRLPRASSYPLGGEGQLHCAPLSFRTRADLAVHDFSEYTGDDKTRAHARNLDEAGAVYNRRRRGALPVADRGEAF